MINEITIFDIPIYYMDLNSYETSIAKQCEDQCGKYARSESEYLGEQAHCISMHKSDHPWRYNQIVGAIRISITNDN